MGHVTSRVRGKTPLHAALLRGNKELIDCLVKRDAKLDAFGMAALGRAEWTSFPQRRKASSSRRPRLPAARCTVLMDFQPSNRATLAWPIQQSSVTQLR